MKLERERGSILKKGSRTGYLEQLERLRHRTTRLLFAAAKSSVLQNMRHPRGVRGICLERDGKDVVRVVGLLQMDVLGAGRLMPQAIARHVKDGEALHLLQTEAMELVAGL